MTVPPFKSSVFPLGIVTDLIPNVAPKFKDCIYALSFGRKDHTQAYDVNLSLVNPDGTIKSFWETAEFKRRYLEEVSALKKLLYKAEQEIKSPQNNEAFFDRLRRSHPEASNAIFNPFSHRLSFNVDIKDDHRPVLRGAYKKTPRLEFDDDILQHSAAEYSGLYNSLNNLSQTKEYLCSVAKTMPVIPKQGQACKQREFWPGINATEGGMGHGILRWVYSIEPVGLIPRLIRVLFRLRVGYGGKFYI